MFAGTDNAYKLAKRYKVKTAFGSDALFDARVASRQGAQLVKLVRWYTPAEVLMVRRAHHERLFPCPFARRLVEGYFRSYIDRGDRKTGGLR